MTKKYTISQRFVSFFLLLLVLNASFFAVFDLKTNAYSIKKQVEQKKNIETNTPTEKEVPTYSEQVSFHAVVGAGLQCEFHKIILAVFPQQVIFYFELRKEAITTAFHHIALLSYFQNIFEIAIQINAP
jgi:hypothetical protein